MAIHNSIILFGKVHGNPVVTPDETGNMVKVMLGLEVISNKERKFGVENNVCYVTPIIMSQNKEIMRKMATLKNNDVIQLKGTFTTKNYTKASICPNCGKRNKTAGILSYVNPIYLEIVKTNNTKAEAIELLKRNQEISNIVTIIGTICQDPELFTGKKGESVLQYQLAIDRKYKIKEDSPLIRTDYPWVKSYGDAAIMDHTCLERGSCVFIDGLLQTRRFTRKATCENEECNNTYEWSDHSLEIVPYQTEYLNNFTTPEEKEKKEREELKNLLSD